MTMVYLKSSRYPKTSDNQNTAHPSKTKNFLKDGYAQ